MPAINDIITQLTEEAPDRPLLTCGDRTVTRGELHARSNRLARAYAELGLSFGDVVAVGLPNSIEYYEATYAIWKLGAVPLLISWRLPKPELTRIIELSGAKMVLGLVEEAGDRLALPAGFEPDPALSDGPLPTVISPAWKINTSGGSTGLPKLIVTGSTGDVDVESRAAWFGLRPDHVQLVCAPLHHNLAHVNSMLGTFLGQHVVVLPKFDAVEALEAITRYRVSHIALVPTMMSRMIRVIDERPGRYDLSSIEYLWHMAAPCPQWLKLRWIDLVGEDSVFELFGATESQAVTRISGSEWLTHRGSVGRAFLGEYKVVDAEGNDMPPGEVGELAMRRPQGAPPTYRYIGATARTLPGGWDLQGDMGSMDEEGYVYPADRQQDMLLVGGSNVYPAEVESVILEHPDVLSCAVVGLPDDDLGQRVHAVVEAKPGLTDDALKVFVKERLVSYKVPRTIRFVDEPLRDDAGKVRRSEVRAREIAHLAEEAATAAS